MTIKQKDINKKGIKSDNQKNKAREEFLFVDALWKQRSEYASSTLLKINKN